MIYEIGSAGLHIETPRLTFGQKLTRLIFPTAVIATSKRFPDVSFYQGNIDWGVMRTQTDAAIIRAGQNVWIDTQFVRNYSEAKRVGIRRGVYWFYDDRVSPITQANILIDLLKYDLPEMEVFADWENTYGGAYGNLSHVVQFMQAVQAGLPSVTMGIYTGYYWFKDHSSAITHASEYDYLKDKPLWLAWYTSNPSYVSIPAPWTRVTHWQYGTPAIGLQYGVQTNEIDMNYYNGTQADFDSRYGSSLPPVPDVLMAEMILDFGNYKAYKTSNGILYHLLKIDVDKVDFFVTPRPLIRHYVTDWLDAYDLDAAINGDGFVSTEIAGFAMSNGQPYGIQGNEEMLCISKDNKFAIGYVPSVWNAISFPNRLITNGVVVGTRLDIDPRTAIGFTQDQKTFYMLCVDGIETYNTNRTGMNFPETAEILLRSGCWFAAMMDGGGSSTMVIDQGIRMILNTPCGEDLVNGYNLRRVANALGVRLKTGGTMPTKKFVAKAYTNIKYMDGVGTTGLGLQVGDWGLGDLSTTGSDIINITEFTRATGSVIQLDKSCKAGVANLTVTNYTPSPPPEPPPPVGETMITNIVITHKHDDGTQWSGSGDIILNKNE